MWGLNQLWLVFAYPLLVVGATCPGSTEAARLMLFLGCTGPSAVSARSFARHQRRQRHRSAHSGLSTVLVSMFLVSFVSSCIRVMMCSCAAHVRGRRAQQVLGPHRGQPQSALRALGFHRPHCMCCVVVVCCGLCCNCVCWCEFCLVLWLFCSLSKAQRTYVLLFFLCCCALCCFVS